jgi:hypothetical protein
MVYKITLLQQQRIQTLEHLPVADIGKQTLKPGVNYFPSSFAITKILTLSGNGVYLFKIGSTLTTSVGNSRVVLTAGSFSLRYLLAGRQFSNSWN